MSGLLLTNAVILDEEAAQQQADIRIDNGCISVIGKALPHTDDCELVDCTGKVVSPSFAVLHAHSPMHLLRGLAEDVSIDDWFNREIWPYESKLTKEDVYLGSRLCMAELIDEGVTAFADHYFMAEQIAKAALDSGLRIDLAPTIFGAADSLERELGETAALIERYRGEPRIALRYGPHSPYLCSPQALRSIVDAAKLSHVGIHIHLSETAAQERAGKERCGRSQAQILSEAGGFTLPCILAHGLWLSTADLSLLGCDTYVAACPKTYAKLGMGMGTLWENAARLNLSIGTDGAASSNTCSPLEQARLFGLLGKLFDKSERFDRKTLWKLLMNGHRALPFGTGRMAVGAPADLIVWELNTPATVPVYDPLTAILYAATAQNIRDVLCAGRFLKRDGHAVQDNAALFRDAAKHAAALTQRGKGASCLCF